MTTITTCTDCGADVPASLATIRTTLGPDGFEPVAWCRTCRPAFMPSQREASK